MAHPALRTLRARTITRSLFAPLPLAAAVERMGFVQADPIRAPASAQDLILRHRVLGYRAGDLERRYPALGLEEDVLYAYGFLHPRVWRLLHPRHGTPPSPLEQEVLAAVHRRATMHPRTLEAELGPARVVNAWGGQSKATTRAMERLHRQGLLRIARREKGVRVYEAAPPVTASHPPEERFRHLLMEVAGMMAPLSMKTLLSVAARLRWTVPGCGDHRKALRSLVDSGELAPDVVDGITYLSPAVEPDADRAPRRVRFLAPFDPVVRDRERFEHLWGWSYRFEAYTPPARRVRGYYALPLLWGDRIIGWANAGRTRDGLDVEVGFAGRCPAGAEFGRALDREIARMEAFLGAGSGDGGRRADAAPRGAPDGG
jgi:uncharacterized protein